MDIPDPSEVAERLGNRVALQVAEHWIPGRRGQVYLVTQLDTGRRSVFKWCTPQELACWRDLLPAAPIATPTIYRSWNADVDRPAAVEMEYIPRLACPHPCYHFAPAYAGPVDPVWRMARLDALFARLGRMHARYASGKRLQAHLALFTHRTVDGDVHDWEANMRKLYAVAHLPGASDWIEFWAPRARRYHQLLAEVYTFPRTWLWGDAKWDHIGCRTDGTVVVLEWSTMLGPAGSDLYLALFEPPARRSALLDRYARNAQSLLGSKQVLEHSIRLGLIRACYLHGPGQACLAIRGLAGAESTTYDKAAWHVDATTTARALAALERRPAA